MLKLKDSLLTLPRKYLVATLCCAMATPEKHVSSHRHLRLKCVQTFVGGQHIVLEGLLEINLHTLSVRVHVCQ